MWRYRFQAGVWNCQLLHEAVELHLFTSLQVRYHKWLPDIELIQMSAFLSFIFQDWPRFHCCKANRGLKLSRNSQTTENDHLHIYSLWSCRRTAAWKKKISTLRCSTRPRRLSISNSLDVRFFASLFSLESSVRLQTDHNTIAQQGKFLARPT
jgi:hypothetical protein